MKLKNEATQEPEESLGAIHESDSEDPLFEPTTENDPEPAEFSSIFHPSMKPKLRKTIAKNGQRRSKRHHGGTDWPIDVEIVRRSNVGHLHLWTENASIEFKNALYCFIDGVHTEMKSKGSSDDKFEGIVELQSHLFSFTYAVVHRAINSPRFMRWVAKFILKI